MSNLAISIKNLTKSFRVWETLPDRELKVRLVKWLKMDFSKSQFKTNIVVEDVSFDVRKGEFVAVMGKNGMGKSTILKLICGIYKPTSGHISVQGSIAPLLELGAGFDPQLTGYENIFLNATILGYDNKTIRTALPAIVEFSGLGDKIYVPIKNYSSGMLVRLGFSIAVHLDFDILLLDEVLGVGDAQFFKKSVDKVLELHKRGKTILLVTHSLDQVVQYCERCILLHDQKKIFDGNPKEMVNTYNALMV